jgi:hypothetical protein
VLSAASHQRFWCTCNIFASSHMQSCMRLYICRKDELLDANLHELLCFY